MTSSPRTLDRVSPLESLCESSDARVASTNSMDGGQYTPSSRLSPNHGTSTPSRPRGNSDSALIGIPASSEHSLNRATCPLPNLSPSSSTVLGVAGGEDLKSSFRSRSRSFNATRDSPKGEIADSSTMPNGVPRTWWNRIELLPRSWGSESDSEDDVPDEQKKGWKVTRQSVAQAAVSVLGTAGLAARGGLVTGLELVQFAPLPGLKPIAATLLKIWEAVQLVNTNRLSFLRLTERCASVLLSIRQDIAEAGNLLSQELSKPIAHLNRVFTNVQVLMEAQSRSPFLKRYLKRNEISGEITHCGEDLMDALRTFGMSVQIRTLKLVQASERQRQADGKFLYDAILSLRQPPGLPLPSITDSTEVSMTAPGSVSVSSLPEDALPTLQGLHAYQDSKDANSDTSDLKQLMRTALKTGSDAELVTFLQIAREEMPEAIKSLQRAMESSSTERSLMKVYHGDRLAAREEDQDMLHREFIESGIDALRRLSKGSDTTLPSWTITKYEVDPGQKIGIGFFSDVYKGTWKGRTVAIKVLADTTPRKLFVREMGIWKTLKHPHVLELYGASSASGDPPWFFVSPYEKNGSLVEFLKRSAMQEEPAGLNLEPCRAFDTNESFSASRSYGSLWRDRGVLLKEGDLYRFMREIAEGMEYLHARGVLHGDLKASNVLVDNKMNCVISDFGLSEMKSEAHRISGVPFPRGTLRWQAPELMAGVSQLTPAIDVYAYAISCIEILTLGQMPWNLMDDDAVRYFILKENSRPPIPSTCRIAEMQDLLRVCWHLDPTLRPPFSQIVLEQAQIQTSDWDHGCSIGSPRLTMSSASEDQFSVRSPDLCPLSPSAYPFSPDPAEHLQDSDWTYPSFQTPWDFLRPPAIFSSNSLKKEEAAWTGAIPMPGPTFYVEPITPSCASSTMFTDTTLSRSWEDIAHFGVYDSISPAERRGAEVKHERIYRLLLDRKDFHGSLSLPLWDPTPVQLGDVGYLSKPAGSFVTLFNAFKPNKSSGGLTGNMPSVAGYGHVARGSQRLDKRNAAQRSLDAVAGLLTFGKSRGNVPVSRRYSFPLRAGHKCAYMCTEATEFQYIKKLEAPKAWFKAHADSILNVYGADHNLQREDLFLVIGTLQTPNYALFVSHNHPEGQVHFDAFPSCKKGHPWGTFTTDTKLPAERGGPSYDEPFQGAPSSASKVSRNGDAPTTVLIARLRFKPDVPEPTSL